MQAQLQRIEIESSRARDDDLAIVPRQTFEQRFMQLREVPVKRPQPAALDVVIESNT